MDLDIFQSEFLANKTLTLSSVGGKGQSGSITLRFQFDQTCETTQLSSGLKDTFHRQLVPASAYAGMKLLEGNIMVKKTPPSWTAMVASLSHIAEAAKPIGEVGY